jgi:hypothetical protein
MWEDNKNILQTNIPVGKDRWKSAPESWLAAYSYSIYTNIEPLQDNHLKTDIILSFFVLENSCSGRLKNLL